MLADYDLCEVFIHGNSRVVQSVHRADTKRMVMGGITNKKRGNFYTWLIFLSGTLTCISFGMMAGWPSCTYPLLLSQEAPIPITLDQSAMIAGMLLNGFVIATPFAGSECLGSKFGVLLGSAVILSGWLVMIVSTNVLLLCVSRLSVGIGAGYGIGKLKLYIQEIAPNKEAVPFQRFLILFINFGVILSFVIGPFVSFKMLSTISAVIAGFAFTSFTVTPETPYNLYRQKKIHTAIESLKYIHGKEYVDSELEKIKSNIENRPENKSLFQILRNSKLRKSFIIVTFIITVQQFSGGPTLIVYNQIIYNEFKCLYPKLCSIVYAIIYFCSSGLGAKWLPNVRRKPVLIISCLICTLTSIVHVCYLYFQPSNVYLTSIPFCTMIVYSISHTFGLATVPNFIINDIFPVNARYTMTCYLNMYTAELAVIVTKIFQVLYDVFGMYISFCMLSFASLLGLFVFTFGLTESKEKTENNRIT